MSFSRVHTDRWLLVPFTELGERDAREGDLANHPHARELQRDEVVHLVVIEPYAHVCVAARQDAGSSRVQ